MVQNYNRNEFDQIIKKDKSLNKDFNQLAYMDLKKA